MPLLDNLWEIGRSLVPSNLRTNMTIKGIWNTELIFQPDISEIAFNCHFLIAQTYYQGCSFYQEDTIKLQHVSSLIGQHYEVAKNMKLPIKIAVLDSIFAFGRLLKKPSSHFEKDGMPSEKAFLRANIVCEEACRLVPARNSHQKPIISVLGVSGIIVHQLIKKGYNIIACDLNPNIIGTKICNNVTVRNGLYEKEYIKESDLVIVTGMALETETMENVFKYAQKFNAKVIVYAQTGANIAPWYISCGANTVICEHIPFYNFEGLSKISVYRG